MMVCTAALPGVAPRPTAALPARRGGSRAARGAVLTVRADNRPLREFNEGTGEVSSGGGAQGGSKEDAPPKFLYADENPQPPRDTMSKEMKEKLRREYYGLGGAPNQAMSSNLFLNIILIISLLAVLSKLTGAI